MQCICHPRRVGDHHLATLSAPAASSWDAAPAAPVQQDDPLYAALIQQDRPSGPDQQRKAAKAAGNQKAVDAHKEIKKAVADRRHAEHLAFKEGGGLSFGCCAHAASRWDSAPAAPVQQNDPRYPAPIEQNQPSGPDQQ